MNFNNIFEYKIKIFKTPAYIQIYEMYDKPTRFTPRNSTLEYIKFKDTYYRCQVYYSLVPRFTLRYKTHNYKIKILYLWVAQGAMLFFKTISV